MGIVVVGEKTARKLPVARHAGIDIINEGDFFRVLANEIRLRNRNRTSSVPK